MIFPSVILVKVDMRATRLKSSLSLQIVAALRMTGTPASLANHEELQLNLRKAMFMILVSTGTTPSPRCYIV